MHIECPACRKVFQIPANRLKGKKKISFYCPACKNGLIKIDLDEQMPTPEAAPDAKDGKALLEGEILKQQILKALKDLPPMPQVVLKAQEVMESPKSSIKALAAVLETDQAIAAKVLRLANSAYYGLSGKVFSLKHASVLLGENTLCEIVTLAGTSSLLGDTLGGYGMGSGELWRHSMAVAFSAKSLAQEKFPDTANEAFVAGLIHDAGKIVLDPYIVERQPDFESYMTDDQHTFLGAEMHVFGFDHAEIAAEVCQHWSIPEQISEAIRYHHNPSESENNTLAYLLHMADYLAMLSGIGLGDDDVLYELDKGSMDFLGLNQESIGNLVLDVIESVEKLEKFAQAA